MLLKDRLMIRREKAHVLEQLPAKQRTIIILNVKRTQQLIKSLKELKQLQSQLKDLVGNNTNSKSLTESLFKCFKESGIAKAQGVCEYLQEVVESGEKVLLFCHHRAVMDKIEEFVKKKLDVGYIRIDGKTKGKTRNEHVKTFQEKPQTRIAILSMTAAGMGLTLTAARIVIFAELY